MAMTLELTQDAEAFLRTRVRKKYGHGAYVSALLLQERGRLETIERLRREPRQQAHPKKDTT